MPDTDVIFNGKSTERLQEIDGGPDHAPSTLMLDCDVQPGIKYPFAGLLDVFHTLLDLHCNELRQWTFLGGKDITFWSRGDGKAYAVAMFTQTGKWTRRFCAHSSPARSGRNTRCGFPNSTPMGTTLR